MLRMGWGQKAGLFNSSHMVRPCGSSCIIWQMTSAKQATGQKGVESGGQLRPLEIHSSVSCRSPDSPFQAPASALGWIWYWAQDLRGHTSPPSSPSALLSPSRATPRDGAPCYPESLSWGPRCPQTGLSVLFKE